MAEEKLSILLPIVSSILSLEANFLDRLSIILPWFWTTSLKVRNWKNYYLDNYLNSYLGGWSAAEILAFCLIMPWTNLLGGLDSNLDIGKNIARKAVEHNVQVVNLSLLE
jgi:hypothetical protein